MNHTIVKNTKKHTSHSQRFIELDILRGIAICGMIFLHLLWDLDYFGILQLNSTIYQTNVLFQILFFLLVGICLAIKGQKISKGSKEKIYSQMISHGLWIFSLGMIFTIVSLLVIPERPVIFGVLHCIGLSILLGILFLKFTVLNFVISTIIIGLGYLITQFPSAHPTFFHLALGFRQEHVWSYTIDYFPLLPWFGVSLFGIALGSYFYKNNTRRFSVPDLSTQKSISVISWFGKHSLSIYLFHQPIIAGVLSLILFL
jgi:uncharacterized membrane protein